MTTSKQDRQILSRREALKTLAAATGAVALANLPNEWETPVIETGLLPAHAQVSPGPGPILGTGDFQATLTWNSGNPTAAACSAGGRAQGAVDVDLHVVEPDGTRIFFGNRTGSTGQLDVDNQRAAGPENVFVKPGQAAAGVYLIQVVFFCGNVLPTIATINLMIFAGTPQQQTFTFTRALTVEDRNTAVNVAQVTYPVGTVQDVGGTAPLSTEARRAAK